MTDKELQHLLPDYINGRLDETIRSEIERRLQTSAELRNALEAAKLYTDAVAAIDPIRAPDDFLDKVHRRIGEKQRLFDRIFRPFHIKLPIELAGVAVTVTLIVLLYNPFSGRLPHQAVKLEAQHYTGLQEPSVASKPAPVAESQPVPPVVMERPASAVAEKKALRRSIAGNVSPESGSGETRKETLSSYASNTTIRAAKSAPRAMASTSMSDEPAAHEAQPSASPPPAPQLEDGYADRMAGVASEEAPAPSARARPAPTAAKEAPAELASSTSAAEYESNMDDVAPEHQKEALRYSSKTRAEMRAVPARKMARPAMKAREAASASSPTNVSDSPDNTALKQIADLVKRYHGTIETVPAERNDMIRLKLTIPSKKFGAFKKILSTEIEVASITDTISASGRSDLIIILEVKPTVGDRQ